jgi:hypothetical protein
MAHQLEIGDLLVWLKTEFSDRTPRGSGLQYDELVNRYAVQCTTQKQNKTEGAQRDERRNCKESEWTSCCVRVPRGLIIFQVNKTGRERERERMRTTQY